VVVPERHGVIDSVATGFLVTNRHLPFLALPIALDLLLWLGPKISIQPLLNRLFGVGSTPLTELGMTGASANDQLAASLTEFNLLGLLSLAMPSSRSMFLSAGEADAALTIGTWPLAFAAVVVLFTAALLIGAFYRSTVVQGVIEPANGNTDGIYDIFVQAAPRYVRLLLIVIGLAMAGLAALTALITVADAVVPGVGSVIVTVTAGVILWLVILFYLSESAVFVSGYGAVASLRASAQIVRAFLWPSVGLFFLLRLIGFGMGMIWGLVGDASLVTVAAIGGNAYIATGLTLAAMVYYRDRMDSMRWNA
jgi:hypothetical protein